MSTEFNHYIIKRLTIVVVNSQNFCYIKNVKSNVQKNISNISSTSFSMHIFLFLNFYYPFSLP